MESLALLATLIISLTVLGGPISLALTFLPQRLLPLAVIKILASLIAVIAIFFGISLIVSVNSIGASHPDHLAAGEATIQAVYPDSRNPFAFTDLLEKEGLQPWRVKEIWVSGFAQPDHWVDITDTFDLKMAALHAHASQTAHNKELENMVREWGQRNAGIGGLPEGRIAEAFKIVHTN